MLARRFLSIYLLMALCFSPVSVEAKEIVLGMSASFTGATRSLGIELYRGAKAYFDYLNKKGGVNGNTVTIRLMDDGYSPLPAIRNTVDLVERDKVFALFNYVGTPTTTRVIPLLKRYSRRDMMLLFPLTGAQVLRVPPYDQYIFNLRASYFDETQVIVEHYLQANRSRIAVFYQADAFGRSGWDGVRRALGDNRLIIVGEATYRRGATFDVSMKGQVEAIMAARPDGVVAVGASEACAAFIRDLRNAGSDVPVATLSFSNCEYLTTLLQKQAPHGIKSYTEGLICSQAMPDPWHGSFPAAQEFRDIMDAYDPGLPQVADAKDYLSPKYSRVAFEGFLNAKLFALALERTPNPVTRKKVRKALEEMRDVDLGLHERISFEDGEHQALHRAYMYRVGAEGLEQIDDFSRWRK